MKLAALLALALMTPATAKAWEILTEREPDGRVFMVAEQAGEAGAYLRLVCFEQQTHIEIVYPTGIPAADDVVELLQVDQRPERLVAGFVDEIDAATSIFVGVDRRDRPAAATETLLAEIAAGASLYLGDPDRVEAIDRWSLTGSQKALTQIRRDCS